MIKRLFISVAVILLIVTASFNAQARRLDFLDDVSQVPAPRLISPISDEVDLTGEKEIVFKWDAHIGSAAARDYYDFRLYKGYDIIESGLILKEKVPPTKHEFSLSADMFENGRVYTWSLKQIYRTGKSKRSNNSFKVIKR